MNNNKRTKQIIGLVIIITMATWLLYYWLTSYLIGRAPMPTPTLYAYQNISAYFLWIKYSIAFIGGFGSWVIQLPGLGTITIIPAIDYGLIVRQYLSMIPLIPHVPARFVSVASVFTLLPYYMFSTFFAACVIVRKYGPSGPVAAPAAGGTVRGAQLISSGKLCKLLKHKHNANFLPLSAPPVIMPWDLESRHVMIAGSTGSGKSVLLCAFLAGICNRRMLNKKIIIYDRKGELTSKFYGHDDIIFNPYDSRFAGWSIFNEFDLLSGLEKIPEQLANIANSLFSVANDNKNKAFFDGAASIFKSGICWLKLNKLTTNKHLYNFFTQNPDDIKAAIDSLPIGLREGAAFLAGTGDVRASFLSCLADRIRAFQPFIGRDGQLSIKNWFADKSDKRKLILATASSASDMYLPILTAVIDIVGHGLRDMPEDPDRRVYVVLDELSSLPPLKTLQMLLREGRSRGASIWLSTQTMASIEAQYGRNNTADIFGLCNSLFVFRAAEPGQSRYFSDALGNAEKLKISQSVGKSNRGFDIIGNESKNKSEQRVTENIVLTGELQGLPVGVAYCKIGDLPISKVRFKNVQIPTVAPYFLKIEDKIAAPAELATAAGVSPEPPEKPPEKQENIFKM